MSTKSGVSRRCISQFKTHGSFWDKSMKALEILGFWRVEKVVENVNNSL